MARRSQRNLRPWTGAMGALAALGVCLGLAGCGANTSPAPTPPPPPTPLGHAYITTPSNLFAYAITASDGTLSSIATPSGAPGGTAVTSNGSKNVVYTVTSGGQISGYSLNRSDGSLAAISGSPWGGAGVGVAFLTVDGAGQDLYVPAEQDLTVVPFSIGSSGALTIGLQVSTPAAPLTATVDPPGHFLYVPMGAEGTELFQITGGALVDGGTIPPQGQGGALFIAITPADTFAYISDGMSGVAGYSVNTTTGALTALAGSPFPAGQGTASLAITPSGKFLYVANAAGLAQFAINADGSLTSIGTPLTLASPPTFMNIEFTGQYLYVLTVNSMLVSIYHIDSSSGLLTSEPAASVPFVPNGITTTP